MTARASTRGQRMTISAWLTVCMSLARADSSQCSASTIADRWNFGHHISKCFGRSKNRWLRRPHDGGGDKLSQPAAGKFNNGLRPVKRERWVGVSDNE